MSQRTNETREQYLERLRAYAQSAKGTAARAKYRASAKGKAARAKYRASDKGKAAQAKHDAKYLASAKGKAAQAKHDAKRPNCHTGNVFHHLLECLWVPVHDKIGVYYKPIRNSSERLKELGVYDDYKLTIEMPHGVHTAFHHAFNKLCK